MSQRFRGVLDDRPVLVDSSGLVYHVCGHKVFWELQPGVLDDFLKEVANHNCPCCGAEAGSPEAFLRRTGKPAPEWPDHFPLGGVGIAHCHDEKMKCSAVNRRHKAGLATKDNDVAIAAANARHGHS